MKVHRKTLLTAAIVALAFVITLHAAKRTVVAKVDVAPTPVNPGAALAVTSSITNTTSDLQTVAIAVQLRGPCGVSASKGYKVLLNGRQSDTSEAKLNAPSCPGDYQAIMTVSDHDGAIIGTAIRPFQVSARELTAR